MIIAAVCGTVLMDNNGNVDSSVVQEILARVMTEHYTDNSPFELDDDDDYGGQRKGMTADQVSSLITEVATHVVRHIQGQTLCSK